MNPADERFLKAALAEPEVPITAGYFPPGGRQGASVGGEPHRILPSWDEIAKLPRWAQVAFAARCAHRLLGDVEQHETSRAVQVAEQAAAQGKVDPNTADAALVAVEAFDRIQRYDQAAYYAAWVAHVATHPRGEADFSHHVISAARLTFKRFASDRFRVALPAQDLSRLLRLAQEQHWTDDTPVPPEVFGPMWEGDPPDWWRDDLLADVPPEATDATGTKDPDPASAESGSK
jgi:hypothetical protein